MQSSITRYQQELEEALAQERAALAAALQDKEVERLAKEAERQAKEAALQAKEAALQDKEAALQDKEAALAEVARLQALLRAAQPQGDA